MQIKTIETKIKFQNVNRSINVQNDECNLQCVSAKRGKIH